MMAAAPRPQPPPAPPSARLERLEGGATAEGVDFERKVAGLAALRSRRLGARFQVFSNVAAAHPFDDVVLRLTVPAPSSPSAPAAAAASAACQQALEDAWATYFLQLKHTGIKALSLKAFTSSKNFDLKKYFEFFLKLRDWHQKKLNPQEALEDGQRLLCEGPMDHCRFVIFTTQKRWMGASTCAADDEDVHKMAREILDTGESHDCVLRFTQDDKKVQAPVQGVLGGSCVALTPLTREEQCQFLAARFDEARLGSQPAQESAKRVLDAIANRVPEDTEAGSLLAAPLHLKMVAEIIIDGGAEPLDGECRWRALNVYELFRKFVRRKEHAYLDKHGFLAANIECSPFFKPDFSQFHQNCAMFLLVSDKRFEEVDPQPFQAYVDANLKVLQRLKTGLMWVGDDRAPRFAHYTLVEYFAAAWLSANVAREAAARTVARSLIAGAKHEGGGGGGVLLHFLDEMLAEDPSLHSAGHHTEAESINDDSLTHVAVNNVESQDPREGPQDSQKGSPNVLQLLFSEAQGSAQGITSLHLAAANGLTACARALIQHGADVHSADAGGRTPLHVAATEGQLNVVEVLLNAGADINVQTNQRDTALALAAQNGHLECVIFLAWRCNDVDAADEQGLTPLHRAAAIGHFLIANVLLDAGANLNAISEEGKTPLDLAISNEHRVFVELMVEMEAEASAGWYF